MRASGRQWPDNAAYHVGFFDKAMALCETMPKPVIAAISGTALAGAFEFTLACDIHGTSAQSERGRKRGFVHETVSGKAIDRAMEIAKRFCLHTPESLAYIKRLVRSAIDTPLAEGLALERNLFMRLCVSDEALARMRSYEAKKITDPSRSLEA